MIKTWQIELFDFSRDVNREESKIRKQSHLTVPSLLRLRCNGFVAKFSLQWFFLLSFIYASFSDKQLYRKISARREGLLSQWKWALAKRDFSYRLPGSYPRYWSGSVYYFIFSFILYLSSDTNIKSKYSQEELKRKSNFEL